MQTIITTCISITVLIGLVAGQIFLISRFAYKIKFNNTVLRYAGRIVFVILAIVVLNLPLCIFEFFIPPHDSYGHQEFSSTGIIVGIVAGMWCLSISLYGIYQLVLDWRRKYKQNKGVLA